MGFYNTVSQGIGAQHAFLLQGSAATDLGTYGQLSSSAQAINSNGQISLWVYPTSKLWQNGTATDLPLPAGLTSQMVTGINDAGAVVAQGTAGDGTGHTVLITQGTATDLGTLGGAASGPTAINSAGEIVGAASDGQGGSHPFLWQNGTVTNLGLLAGDTFGTAEAINRAGTVVGYSAHGPALSATFHAFIWQSGGLLDLNSLILANSGWTLEAATSINDAGQIVGWGQFAGQTHAFLLTPQ